MKIDASDFLPIVPQCMGCSKVDPQDLPDTKPVEIIEVPMNVSPEMPKPVLEVPETRRCMTFLSPESKWMNGRKCPVATHLAKEEKKEVKYVDPIKKSKRSMGK
jgi:hypothetical protein